jgi:hypothetical protein
MIFGITTFTVIHVVLSLIGIFAGLVVAGGLVAGKWLDGWTALKGFRAESAGRIG